MYQNWVLLVSNCGAYLAINDIGELQNLYQTLLTYERTHAMSAQTRVGLEEKSWSLTTPDEILVLYHYLLNRIAREPKIKVYVKDKKACCEMNRV